MKNPTEVMPEATASVFSRLRPDSALRNFTLIGGTALSLHLGHRLSEDLDFIYLEPKLPVTLLRVLLSRLSQEGCVVQRDDLPEDYDDFHNAGMALEDYSQNYIINKRVKLTFFAADSHHRKILSAPVSEEGGFAIASVSEIFALKALVASSRSKSRDWLDLYLLCREHGYTLDQWHAVYQKAGYSEGQFETAMNRICSGRVADPDPGFQSLLPSPPTVKMIAAFFTGRRDEYEKRLAAAVLGKK